MPSGREQTLDEYVANLSVIHRARKTYMGLDSKLAEIWGLLESQINDPALWFVGGNKTAAEAYLQQELRKLHAHLDDLRAYLIEQND